jgi:DNA-binding GntR family transcriptional regulator
MMPSLWNRSHLYRRVFTYLPDRAVQALQEHKEIYEACHAGDSESAGKAVRRNIRQTVSALLDEFQRGRNLKTQSVNEDGQVNKEANL